MSSTRTGYYDWGHTRQSTSEQIHRARIDLHHAEQALDNTDPSSPAHTVMVLRYERARQRLAELEAES